MEHFKITVKREEVWNAIEHIENNWHSSIHIDSCYQASIHNFPYIILISTKDIISYKMLKANFHILGYLADNEKI